MPQSEDAKFVATLFDVPTPDTSPTAPEQKKPGRKKRPWTHPTKARVKDEAKTRFGRKSRVLHVRLSEPEYAALTEAMKAAGTHKLSSFVRFLCLSASEKYLHLDTQAVPLPAHMGGPATVPATVEDDVLDRWVAEHAESDPATDFTLFPDDPAPVVRPVQTSPTAVPPVPPVPAVPPVPPSRSAEANPPLNLALLRELRALVPEANVTADVLAALDADDGIE